MTILLRLNPQIPRDVFAAMGLLRLVGGSTAIRPTEYGVELHPGSPVERIAAQIDEDRREQLADPAYAAALSPGADHAAYLDLFAGASAVAREYAAACFVVQRPPWWLHGGRADSWTTAASAGASWTVDDLHGLLAGEDLVEAEGHRTNRWGLVPDGARHRGKAQTHPLIEWLAWRAVPWWTPTTATEAVGWWREADAIFAWWPARGEPLTAEGMLRALRLGPVDGDRVAIFRWGQDRRGHLEGVGHHPHPASKPEPWGR